MGAHLNIFIAFAAGLLSFLSPCVVPLIPSYLSFVSGASFDELRNAAVSRRRILSRTLFFVLGFTIVFVVLGIIFSGPMLLFGGAVRWINLGAGLVVILLGINVMFDLVGVLNVERRFHLSSRPVDGLGATAVGMAFGAGWSPCIGPILASILFLAGTQGQVSRAALLLAVYSLGLGLPFIVTGAAFSRASRLLGKLRPHMGAIKTVSGLFLIAVGVLIMVGRFQQINAALLAAGFRLENWSTADPARSRLVFGSISAASALLPPALGLVRRKRPIIGTAGVVFSAVFLIIAVAGFVGTIDIATLVAGWLRFQGI